MNVVHNPIDNPGMPGASNGGQNPANAAAGGDPAETPELTPEEQARLIELGQQYEGLTKQFPAINFQELPKAYTQNSQKLAAYEKGEIPAPTPAPASAPIDPVQAVIAEKFPKAEDREYFTQNVLPVMMTLAETVAQKTAAAEVGNYRQESTIESTIAQLSRKYDGENGYPKFNAEEVMRFGQDNSIFDLEAAYMRMNFDAIVAAEATRGTRPPRNTFSEGPAGRPSIEMPSGKKLSFDDNSLKDAVRNAAEQLIASKQE